jgi:AI-2 transport protein TqsA
MSSEPADGASSGLPRGLVVLLGIAAAVIAGTGMYFMSWLIGPVFLALTIVIVVSPLQGRLLRLGLPHWAATTLLILAVYAVLIVLGVVLVVSVAQLTSLLPQYVGKATSLMDSLTGTLARFGIGRDQLSTIASTLDLGKIAGVFTTVLSALGNLVSNLFLLLVLMLFLTLEATIVDTRLAAIAEDRPTVAAALTAFARGTRKYMVVTTVFGLIGGAVNGTFLAILGVPLPIMWGLLSFITNYIPNIGFVIGLVPPALLALLDGGWQPMVAVIAFYIVANFVIESLIQPRFVGDAVGLSVTITFVALLFWSWLIGPVGAILAIPLTLLSKALLIDIDPRARWADAFISARVRETPTPDG